MSTISTNALLLEIRHARYLGRAQRLDVTLRLDLAIAPRQVVLVKLDRQPSIGLVADACCGLVHPIEGDTRFMGRDWRRVGADEANAMRGSIGRVFGRGAWVRYLGLAENMLIQQMHHTRRPLDELREEAARLAQHFGLPGLPTGLPESLSAEDLQRAALVRAFLGEPKLIVLEQPIQDNTELLSPLVTAVLRAREHGAAVLWLASRVPSADLLSLCDQRLRVRHSGQMEVLR